MDKITTSARTYLFVYLGLLVLLAATIGVARIDLGVFNTVIAIVISATKAVLVILFFMHVRGSDQLTRVFVVLGFFWLSILIGLTLTDYLTRITIF